MRGLPREFIPDGRIPEGECQKSNDILFKRITKVKKIQNSILSAY